jgi:hypothetical protein
MIKNRIATSAARALTQDELDAVAGGQQVYSHEFPTAGKRSFEPVFGPPASIAQGEINENQTDNNLP